MKKNWTSYLVLFAVCLVLTGFLGLQYYWLNKIAASDSEKMQKRVADDTQRFADDFNQELQNAYFGLELDGQSWQNDHASGFGQWYDYWKTNAKYPTLVKAIFFVENQQAMPAFQYEPEMKAFVAAKLPAELANLPGQLNQQKGERLVFDDVAAVATKVRVRAGQIHRIVIDNRGREDESIQIAEALGSLIVVFDKDTIKNVLLPDLVAKYFPEGDFRVSVVDKKQAEIFATKGGITTADATVPMFALNFDKFIFVTKLAAKPASDMAIRKKTIVVDDKVVTENIRGPELQAGSNQRVEVKVRGANPISSVRATNRPDVENESAWNLQSQHIAGSVVAFANSERNKSFLLGFGVYLLLVGSIVAIFLSAMRAKRYAQRQIDFVSSVSHEFRTPLAVIYSAGENLADGVTRKNEQISQYGELIKGEGKKLSTMVEQILEFAGAGSGKRKYNFKATDINALIDEVVDECRPGLEAQGFELNVSLTNEVKNVLADSVSLKNALANLINNSAKYSNGTKWVRISAVSAADSVKIEVEDRGIGISRRDIKDIFQPFYRSRDVVDAQIHGNGLGLSIVKQVVTAHGGKLNVISEKGKGSRFIIELNAYGEHL